VKTAWTTRGGPHRSGPDAAAQGAGPSVPELAWRPVIRRRVGVILVVLGLWSVAIQGRLVQLQAFRHDEYAALAIAQQQRVISLAPKRGDIIDRHGDLLASSKDGTKLGADPGLIEDPAAAVDALCGALGDCTRQERKDLHEQFGRETRWVPVREASDVTPEQAEAADALDLPWLVLQTESVRSYPNGRLAAHVLGFVGTDGGGLAGIEARLDDDIRGTEGRVRIRKDAHQNRLMTEVEQPATAGATIELTIDQVLQYVAERELAAGVAETRALGGTAIVMDPSTGEVLALANLPDFDPNVFDAAPRDAWRNRAVQDVYEPGSTFKIVTASAALEARVVAPHTMIDVSSGYLRIPGRSLPIIDDHPAGRPLTFEDVIVKSSNVGAATVGLWVGAERLSSYARRFGFGQILTADFAGQSGGVLFPPQRLNDVALASMSMGYNVSVTALQMATAVSAIANGGDLMEPHIVRARIRNGTREEMTPQVIRRVVTPEVAATLRSFMVNVVNRGTATAAALDRHQVAGKTGTAKKAIPGGYSATDRIASFVGFVPADRPAFTILVVIDTPRNGQVYGGAIAAPVFKHIAEAALRLGGIAPTVNPESPFVVTRPQGSPEVEPVLARTARSARAGIDPGSGTMPDVRGLGIRDALAAIHDAGLTADVLGSGVVIRQAPEAGSPVASGTTTTLVLDRPRSGGPPGGALR